MSPGLELQNGVALEPAAKWARRRLVAHFRPYPSGGEVLCLQFRRDGISPCYSDSRGQKGARQEIALEMEHLPLCRSSWNQGKVEDTY
jgi:hypothetical protein